MATETVRQSSLLQVSIRPRYSFCEEVARNALDKFLSSITDKSPPIQIDLMARYLGFQVVKLFTAGEEFSGMVSPRHKLIGVNGNHHPHRQRFTVAHEIAHVLLKHPPESRCTGREIAVFNVEADVCASELLMPRALLLQSVSPSTEYSGLARAFDVSEEALERKLRIIVSARHQRLVFPASVTTNRL